MRSKGKWAMLLAALGLSLAVRENVLRRREADLRGDVVLITGGSRGLGLLLAREFAHDGCRLAICARDGEELNRSRRELEAQGAMVHAVTCDVSDRAQVERLVQEVTRQFGRIDVLVNNAGIIQVGPVQSMKVEDYEAALGTMLWGALYPTLAVLPQMLERQSGRIVNITSVGAKASVPHLLPYNCAKFAAIGLSEGLHAELAKHKIKVITIVPGLMRTGSFLNALFKGNQKEEFAWFALGSSLPFISMDAERAARQIVRATRRGETEVILSLPANLLARFHGLFPGVTVDLLGLANRILLPPPDGAVTVPGLEVHSQLRSPLLDIMIHYGLTAARRFQELPASAISTGTDRVRPTTFRRRGATATER